MRKIFTWGILCLTGTGVIAILAHQIFSASTQRVRDVSVAALQEKIASLSEGGREVLDDKATFILDEDVDLPSLLDSPSDIDARWHAIFKSVEAVYEDCGLTEEEHNAVTIWMLRPGEETLTEVERMPLEAFLSCSQNTRDELLALCRFPTSLPEFYGEDTWPRVGVLIDGLYRVEFYLRQVLLYASAISDHETAIDTLIALPVVSRLRTRRKSVWRMTSYIDWHVIRQALESGTVHDSQWDEILAALVRRRSSQEFVNELAFISQRKLARVGKWPLPGNPLPFSEYPLQYAQNWAYMRVTTPLYNHDIDRFSRAMTQLFDIAQLSDSERDSRLEIFYKDFDVEPSTKDLKFTRNNGGWRYVVELCRVTFPRFTLEQAAIDVACIAILLDRFHRENGVYPESLDILAPALGGAVPLNPFDGKPYIYALDGDVFHLGFRRVLTAPPNEVDVESIPFYTFWNDPKSVLATEYQIQEMGGDSDRVGPETLDGD